MSFETSHADNVCSIEQLKQSPPTRINGIVPLRFRNQFVTRKTLSHRSRPLQLGELVTIAEKKSVEMTTLDENIKIGRKMLHNKIVTKINYLLMLYPITEDLPYVLLCHSTSAAQPRDIYRMHLMALRSSLNCILKHSTNLQDMKMAIDPNENEKYGELTHSDIALLHATIVAQQKKLENLLQDHRALMGHFVD